MPAPSRFPAECDRVPQLADRVGQHGLLLRRCAAPSPTARSRTRAPSSSIISVSTSAAILMAASWCQVPYGIRPALHPVRPATGGRRADRHGPEVQTGVDAGHRQDGGGAGRVGQHDGRVDRVVALPVDGGGDVEFLAHHRLRRPVAAVHRREDVGHRDPAERPHAGRRRNGLRRVGRLLGGRPPGRRAFLVAGSLCRWCLCCRGFGSRFGHAGNGTQVRAKPHLGGVDHAPRPPARCGQPRAARYRLISSLVELSCCRSGSCVGLQLRDHPLGQLLAQFDPPLVERSDRPDRALGEHAVLVQRDQLAEHVRASACRSGMSTTGGCPRTP